MYRNKILFLSLFKFETIIKKIKKEGNDKQQEITSKISQYDFSNIWSLLKHDDDATEDETSDFRLVPGPNQLTLVLECLVRVAIFSLVALFA